MFKNLIKRKLLMIGLLVSVVILLTPIATVKAVDDSCYENGKCVVSRYYKNPTKTSNNPEANGLPDIPEITIVNKVLSDNISDLNTRLSDDEAKIKEINEAVKTLLIERDKAEEIVSAKGFIANLIDNFDILNVSAVMEGSQGLHYNRNRIMIIDAMRNNAEAKKRHSNYDRNLCVAKIGSISVKEAMASGDKNKIDEAQTEQAQRVAKLKSSMVAVQQMEADAKALNDASCWPSGSATPDIGNCILIGTGWVGNIITWVFALLLWIASSVFDLSVFLSISTIRTWFGTEAVATVWKVCRDLANLCFVFVLLYIALGTVFELAGLGDPKKLIVNVVLIALLVNFSGFFTRVVIDASNVVAYEFYPQISDKGGIATNLVRKMDLGAYFIEASTLAEANSGANKNFITPQIKRLNFISIIGQTFGNIIIILITSFVLLTAAILFLIRTIYLLFLYIFSPLAFVSMTIPNPKFNFFKQWWDKLISQAFFAPAFLVPLYVVFQLLGKNGIADIAGTGAGALALPLMNAVIIGLLLGCIFIANKFGAAGAGVASKVGKGLGWGALGMAGAHTIGRGAARIGRSDMMRNLAASSPRIGRLATAVTSRVAGGGFGTGAKAGGFTQRTTARRTSQQATLTGFTGPEGTRRRVEFLAGLNRRDRDVSYAKLSAPERSAINRFLENPLTGTPYGGAGEATRLTASLTTTAGATAQRETQADITNIQPSMITDLPPAYLARLDVASHLTIQQLDAIRASTSPILPTERRAIRATITGIATPTAEEARLAAWLAGPGAGF